MILKNKYHLFHQSNHGLCSVWAIIIASLLYFAIISTPANANGDRVIRINAGGKDYIDSAGHLWSADTGFNTGNTSSSANSISATDDNLLFQTKRWDSSTDAELAYSFSVPNDDYQVTLYFAETYDGAFDVGKRVFDVFLENQRVLDNLDVYAEVGPNAALVKSFTVTVSDGQLNLDFVREIENPMISAIEILTKHPKTHLTLSWIPVSGKVSGYRIYYGATRNSATQFFSDLHIASGEINSKSPSVTYRAKGDLSMYEGDTACFRITAYNSSGESKFSKPLCKTL